MEVRKAEVLSTLTKITDEDRDKYHVYHDIYHALKDSCDCRIPENKILPEREDLLRFLRKKMLDHEIHGRIHERLIELVKNLEAVDTFPAGHMFRMFNDPEDYEDALRGRYNLYGAEMVESSRKELAGNAKRPRNNEDKNDDVKKN